MLRSLYSSYRSLTLINARNYARGSRSTKRITEKHSVIPNTGITGQVRVLQEVGIEEDNIDMEMLEESESNLFNVDRSYVDYKTDVKKHKDLVRLRTVKQKYFDTVSPNLLTWSEKEQIRHLHEKHPVEWTPEKLAESFPATPETIKKLLKYAWKPASEKRIERHDASVLRNWRQLQEGNLEEISPALREHLLTFTNRKIPPRRTPAEPESPEPKIVGEFESIVAKPETNDHSGMSKSNPAAKLLLDKLEILNKVNLPNISRDQLKNAESGPLNRSNYTKSAYVTMTDLQNKIDSRIKSGKTVKAADKYFHEALSKSNLPETVPNVPQSVLMKLPSETSISSDETREGKILMTNKEQMQNEDDYPDHITIPEAVYKFNSTYKVKDCYYDYDGEFLYRVPGMSN